MVSVIEQYYAAGGTSKPTVRALVPTLRRELNVVGPNDVLRAAVLRYGKRLGMPIQEEAS